MKETMFLTLAGILFFASAAYGDEKKGFASATSFSGNTGLKSSTDATGDDRYPVLPVTLDAAIAAASAKVPGKVRKVEYERGRYEIKIVTSSGGMKEVYVNASSGEVVRIKDEGRSRR